jgi:hypothetical protein
LQNILNYARYKELTANFKTDQSEVDKIANDINAKWWTKKQTQIDQMKIIITDKTPIQQFL